MPLKQYGQIGVLNKGSLEHFQIRLTGIRNLGPEAYTVGKETSKESKLNPWESAQRLTVVQSSARVFVIMRITIKKETEC